LKHGHKLFIEPKVTHICFRNHEKHQNQRLLESMDVCLANERQTPYESIIRFTAAERVYLKCRKLCCNYNLS